MKFQRKSPSPQQPSQPTSKPELSKPATASEIADIVVTQMRKIQISQSTRDLRGKEYELVKQIRKMESDHKDMVRHIDDYCRNLGRSRGPSCGASQMHDESVAYEKAERNYIPQAESLRDAMLAKLPPQPRPEEGAAVLDPDYLDGLAAKLP